MIQSSESSEKVVVTDEEGKAPSPHSHSQAKREARTEAWRLKKEEDREVRAQRRKEKRRAKNKAFQAARERYNAGEMTRQEREAFEEAARVYRTTRKNKSSKAEDAEQRPPEDCLKIVIDLGFAELMTEKEQRSLVKQLGLLYSANMKVDQPALLSFTDCGDARNTDTLDAAAPHWQKWHVDRREGGLATEFRSDELVYLTAESGTVLHTLDFSKRYVIGGVVDHNRLPGTCHEKAIGLNVATARLDLDAWLALQIHRKAIVTVNQCFSVLLDVSQALQAPPDCKEEGEDKVESPALPWMEAFLAALPSRNIRKTIRTEGERELEEKKEDSILD
jgi:tRNA (guanine9-N1)-methyltransferase